MERFYFEEPSLKRKEEIIDYLNEFRNYKSNINGTGGLDKIFDGYSFEKALERCLNMKDKEYAKANNRCQGKTFLLIREHDDKIVGTINVRWNLNDAMKEFGGNIGYGIRPSERRKGYNKINLYLGLKEAEKLGLKEVMLSCYYDNIASNKSIKALGGKLKESKIDPSDNTLTNIYLLSVDDCINTNKKEYEQYISK